MSKDRELGTFRIGDVRRPEVRSSKKAEAAPAQEASSSLGFPALEERLETGTVESVAGELQGSYSQLEAMAEKGDMRSKAAAKKAMAAYERTADLFEYLFETKAALEGTRR